MTRRVNIAKKLYLQVTIVEKAVEKVVITMIIIVAKRLELQ